MKTGFKREKNSETGEKATSATVQVADIKLPGSTSKYSKSLDFTAGGVKTGFQQQRNALTGETATSAGFKAADFEWLALPLKSPDHCSWKREMLELALPV